MEVLYAVEHVALCGYAHMDLKPPNLLVAAACGGVEGEIQLRLGDFGTVVPLTADLQTAMDGNPVFAWLSS